MRLLATSMAGLALGLITAVAATLPHTVGATEAQFDVCEPQVVADLKRRFGHDATRVEWAWDDGSSDEAESSVELGSAVVYAEQCDGYYWYEVFANRATCEDLVHYGEVPDYIFFRSVNGACSG
jgi:hypothetical protein